MFLQVEEEKKLSWAEVLQTPAAPKPPPAPPTIVKPPPPPPRRPHHKPVPRRVRDVNSYVIESSPAGHQVFTQAEWKEVVGLRALAKGLPLPTRPPTQAELDWTAPEPLSKADKQKLIWARLKREAVIAEEMEQNRVRELSNWEDSNHGRSSRSA